MWDLKTWSGCNLWNQTCLMCPLIVVFLGTRFTFKVAQLIQEWVIFLMFQSWASSFCFGTSAVHRDIYDSWTRPSLNLTPLLCFLPSPGLRWELHRHGLRVIRQLLQSAAGVSESDVSLVFTCFSPSAHTAESLVWLKAIWEQLRCFLATPHKIWRWWYFMFHGLDDGVIQVGPREPRCSMSESPVLILFLEANYHPPWH